MPQLDALFSAINAFAGLKPEELALSENMWQECFYRKDEVYNERRSVCKNLGFIMDGVFRSYMVDDNTGEEKNVFLYSGNQFVVSFKSFINQIPCDYHTQAMTDARVLCIHINDLLQLYRQSHAWEHFGRLLAQTAFNVVMNRTESFLFRTPEQRYLDLLEQHPDICNAIPLYHISSYLGIQGPSLSRIRKRLAAR
jgi:CRP-like cAMP-binding protein